MTTRQWKWHTWLANAVAGIGFAVVIYGMLVVTK
jgi:hypothetical protein